MWRIELETAQPYPRYFNTFIHEGFCLQTTWFINRCFQQKFCFVLKLHIGWHHGHLPYTNINVIIFPLWYMVMTSSSWSHTQKQTCPHLLLSFFVCSLAHTVLDSIIQSSMVQRKWGKSIVVKGKCRAVMKVMRMCPDIKLMKCKARMVNRSWRK